MYVHHDLPAICRHSALLNEVRKRELAHQGCRERQRACESSINNGANSALGAGRTSNNHIHPGLSGLGCNEATNLPSSASVRFGWTYFSYAASARRASSSRVTWSRGGDWAICARIATHGRDSEVKPSRLCPLRGLDE
jgi:hypothetical protein